MKMAQRRLVEEDLGGYALEPSQVLGSFLWRSTMTVMTVIHLAWIWSIETCWNQEFWGTPMCQ